MNNLPDPFQLPSNLSLSQEEIAVLGDFIRSDTWKNVVSKVFDQYYGKLTWDLYNASENHAHIQGAIRAVSQVRHVITHPQEYFRTKSITDESDLVEKWTDKNRQVSSTGY